MCDESGGYSFLDVAYDVIVAFGASGSVGMVHVS